MRGPGRPKGGLGPAVRARFDEVLRTGATIKAAAAAAGVSRSTGQYWVGEAGGVRPKTVNPAVEAEIAAGAGPLTFVDRCRIQQLIKLKYIPAQIADLLGRSRSTITREIARGRVNGGTGSYQARHGQLQVDRGRQRPREPKLAVGTRLLEEVLQRLKRNHSPEQIAGRLRIDFPDEPEMWVSHETIYLSLYVHARGELADQVATALRTGRIRRKHRGRPSQNKDRFPDMINISERPAEVEDRAVPGHWEGDLIIGKNSGSAIGTLVERTTGFVALLHLPNDHTAATVAAAMTAKLPTLPELLRRSLTWDQGSEMALHTQITQATGLPIYFCDPHSPWQRGTNENTNGLLRQYFPKSADLSFYGPGMLDQVAAELNARPRKRHNWATPAERLDQLLSNPPDPVASTA